MSSSVVNDFLSALFDNTATSDGDASNSEPTKNPVDSSAPLAHDPSNVKQGNAGIKRQREEVEERKSVTEQPDSKRMAVGSASDAAKAKQQQPTRKTPAPKPQYQPFQQQLLGSTGLSDPYDAYIASQKLHGMKKSSPRAKNSSAIPSDGRSESSRNKTVNQNNHLPHTHPVPKTTLDKYPDEARMFIKNLPPTAAYNDIANHFSKYGKITEVVLKSGNPFVQFETINACRAAVDNENGKPFKSVELVLELSYKRPQNHRHEAPESFNNQRNRRNDNRKPNPPGKAYSQNNRPPGQSGYAHSDKPGPHKGEWNHRQANVHNARGQGNNNRNNNNNNNYRDDPPHRNRPQDSFDQQRQLGNHRNQHGAPEANRRPAPLPSSQPTPYRQNGPVPRGPKASFWPPQRRYGQAVPVVELIVWDKVPDSFITYIEGRFRASRQQLHTTYLHHNDVDKNTLMQHFVIEGVTAVIMVDRNDEAQGKLYMQVFRRSGTTNDSNVHFDEYAGISVDDAVSVVTRANNNPRSSPLNSMMLTQSYSQATPPQAPVPVVQPVSPNVQQPYQYGYAVPQPQVPAATQPPAAVDYNTVAALLGMMQNVAQPTVAANPGVNNAALQLLTSLVNNGATNTNTAPQPPMVAQQYDPDYSQMNYNPQTAAGYNAYSQPPNNQMAYTTSKPTTENDNIANDSRSWQQNNNQYYPGYLDKSSPSTKSVPASSQAAPTTTNVGEILARLQILQQQSQQK
ncbi:hypothetical protein BC943DRAFT_316285 [Umbelopsis sp. AD052]|nr:hypothetical protein BC943DRAFT_316285 [Umbelopsis sp. AD052]